jgi:hypothetical protein
MRAANICLSEILFHTTDGVTRYADLISKLRAAMHWVVLHRDAVYVGKFDDDAYVNAPVLLKDLETHSPVRKYFFGGQE